MDTVLLSPKRSRARVLHGQITAEPGLAACLPNQSRLLSKKGLKAQKTWGLLAFFTDSPMHQAAFRHQPIGHCNFHVSHLWHSGF